MKVKYKVLCLITVLMAGCATVVEDKDSVAFDRFERYGDSVISEGGFTEEGCKVFFADLDSEVCIQQWVALSVEDRLRHIQMNASVVARGLWNIMARDSVVEIIREEQPSLSQAEIEEQITDRIRSNPAEQRCRMGETRFEEDACILFSVQLATHTEEVIALLYVENQLVRREQIRWSSEMSQRWLRQEQRNLDQRIQSITSPVTGHPSPTVR